jgi:hypothetical protein
VKKIEKQTKVEKKTKSRLLKVEILNIIWKWKVSWESDGLYLVEKRVCKHSGG